MTQAREDEAIEVLAYVEATSIDDPVITTQRDEIKFNITCEKENVVRWRDLLLRSKTDDTKTLRRLLLGASIQAMQQLQGTSPIKRALYCLKVFTY